MRRFAPFRTNFSRIEERAGAVASSLSTEEDRGNGGLGGQGWKAMGCLVDSTGVYGVVRWD